MKSRDITLIILLSIAIISLFIYGYLKAVPAPSGQTSNKPRIKVIPSSFNFGEIKYGEIAKYTFTIKNSGNQILKINKVATSCACTSAVITKKNLKPGEETNLKVEYNTGAMSGPYAKGKQERIIYIKSNDPETPQVEAVITAYVK